MKPAALLPVLLACSALSAQRIGGSYTVTTSVPVFDPCATRRSSTILLIGLSRTALPVFALPPVIPTGCWLLTSGEVRVPAFAHIQKTLAIPNDPRLVGLSLHHQAMHRWVLDRPFSPRYQLSDGLTVTIRP